MPNFLPNQPTSGNGSTKRCGPLLSIAYPTRLLPNVLDLASVTSVFSGISSVMKRSTSRKQWPKAAAHDGELTAATRQKIVEWRQRELSAGDIAQLLNQEAIEISVRTIERDPGGRRV